MPIGHFYHGEDGTISDPPTTGCIATEAQGHSLEQYSTPADLVGRRDGLKGICPGMHRRAWPRAL